MFYPNLHGVAPPRSRRAPQTDGAPSCFFSSPCTPVSFPASLAASSCPRRPSDLHCPIHCGLHLDPCTPCLLAGTLAPVGCTSRAQSRRGGGAPPTGFAPHPEDLTTPVSPALQLPFHPLTLQVWRSLSCVHRRARLALRGALRDPSMTSSSFGRPPASRGLWPHPHPPSSSRQGLPRLSLTRRLPPLPLPLISSASHPLPASYSDLVVRSGHR